MGMDRRTTDQQVILLQQKLDDHIHNYENHCADEERKWAHLIAAQERNTECIKDLTQSTKELTESTRDIISAWDAANGTVKTLSALGKFVKWLSGFAVVGVAIDWVIKHLN